MLSAEDVKKITCRFSKLKVGAVFIYNYKKRIDLTFAIIDSVVDNIDFVVWIATGKYFATALYFDYIKCFVEGEKKHFYFFSLEDLSLNDLKYLELYELASKYRVMCVVDGSVSIKNANSGRTKRLLAMKNKFEYRLILSEMPLTLGVIDLYAQFSFLDSMILNMTQTQFRHNFLSLLDNDFALIKRWSTPENEKNLVNIIKPYVLACDFKNSFNANYYSFDFELTTQEALVYQKEKEDFLDQREHIAFLQVVQHFQYLYTLCKRKVDTLLVLVDDIIKRNEKVIIYTKFLSEIRFLKESGVLKGKKFVVMSGNSNKVSALDCFEHDVNIMICTYKVEIPRLMVKNCTNVIFFTQTFDYKDKLQILFSCCHDNDKKVNVYDFWVNTGLENLIRDNLYRKKKCVKACLPCYVTE